MARRKATLVAALLGSTLVPLGANGQPCGRTAAPGTKDTKDTIVRVVPGPDYQAGPFSRRVRGDGWRDVWLTPVDAPVLDLDAFSGGLKLVQRGGNMQSITMHLQEENGWREYRFRSVDKDPVQHLPWAVRDAGAAAAVLRDQTSAMFPAAPLLVPPFMDAIGALSITPTLYVMPNDARLGVYRDSVGGMLGMMELKGQEAPKDRPGFAGSRKIKGTENFLDDLEKSRAHRLDEEEFLAVRLVDFLINDSDRTPPNMDWARFGEDGDYRWRPIARDRDRAFTDARGWLNAFVLRPAYPKLIPFGREYSYKGLTYSSHSLDRRLLQRLAKRDFSRIALRVRNAITDDVIDAAIARMPQRWREQTTAPARLRAILRVRRDSIPAIAMRFYEDLATDVDVRATNEAEGADVGRDRDGTVTVTIIGRDERERVAEGTDGDGSAVPQLDGTDEAERSPFYRRTFDPAETSEIRIYLGGGGDRAVVRGAASDAIVVRVIGGRGDDILADSAGGGATHLYDAEGENRFVTMHDTHVSRRPWTELQPSTGFRSGQPWRPDWGGGMGWSPVVGHKPGAGVIIGFGPEIKSYGFRRLPHHWKAGAKLLVGTGNRRLGVTADADYRFESSPLALTLSARATGLEALRFFGYGNNTARLSRDSTLVDQTIVAVEPALVWHLGLRARDAVDASLAGNPIGERANRTPAPVEGVRPMVGELELGPVLRWVDPHPLATSPLATTDTPGRDAFRHVGARFAMELNRTDRDAIPTAGWRVRADITGVPSVWNTSTAFTTSAADAAFYIPLAREGPHLAMRAGGSVATGTPPVQYAPTIGGWRTLRGYSSGRYTGDAAIDGSTELHVPVGTVDLLLRWDAGVFGLADVGRVWFDGASEGSWHGALGGGVWLTALGKSVSFAYARGDSHRFYLKTDLF
jgi:hypothetical protein